MKSISEKQTIVKSISGKLCQTSLIADGLVQPLLLLLGEGLVQLREVRDASCAAVLSCGLAAAAPEPAAPPTSAFARLHLVQVRITALQENKQILYLSRKMVPLHTEGLKKYYAAAFSLLQSVHASVSEVLPSSTPLL